MTTIESSGDDILITTDGRVNSYPKKDVSTKLRDTYFTIIYLNGEVLRVVESNLEDVTTPSEGTLADLQDAVIDLLEVAAGGGGGDPNAVPNTRTITINGTQQDLTADRSWSVGDLLASVANATFQTLANLQNNLTPSGTKYPTVNAVIAALALKQDALPTGGNTGQYLRGDYTLATFPTIPTNSDYVDKSTAQTGIGGAKTFSALMTLSAGASTAADIVPSANNTLNIGGSSFRFLAGYFSNINANGALNLYSNASNGIDLGQTSSSNRFAGWFATTGSMYVQAPASRPTEVTTSIFSIYSTAKGSLPAPRMTTAQRVAISSPAEGLEVYDTDLHTKCVYNGTGWRVGNFLTTTSAGTLSITTASGTYVGTGTTSTWTLPATSGLPTGDSLTLFNRGSGTVTLNAASGASVIYDSGVVTATIPIATTENYTLRWDGTYWLVLN